MAKSGTIIGSKSGTRPHLELDWSTDRQEVANNRSRVRLRLYLRVLHNIGYNARYTGKLQGASFTASAGYLSKPGRYLLHERYVWINHNSDGTKKARLTASYNISITWSSTYYSSISLSGDASLDAIPRASTLSSGSISSNLKVGTSNTLNLGISRKHSGFTHLVTILDGGTWVADWGYGTQTPSSLTISGTAVNRMLNRMGSVTSKNFTLRLRTYSGSNGSGYIGESTRTIKATVDGSVKPKINSTSASITGNSWAKNQGIYVQGQTGVQAEFSSSAVGGASVKSRNIKISNTNGGSVVGSVFRHTISKLNNVGKQTITYEITDSRNRKTTATRTIDILAYSPPRITSVRATRQSSNNTRVDVYRAGSTSSLGNKNQATLKIDYKRTTATSWTNLTTINFYGTFNNTNIATNIPISTSYDFRVTVSDKLGQSASSQESVSTAKVLMSYNKDVGVGIGKIHERGALDVAGSAYFAGPVYLPHIISRAVGHTGNFNDTDRTSFYHMGASALNTPSGVWGFLYTNSSVAGGNSPAEYVSQIYHERDGRQDMYSRAKTKGQWRDWKMIAQVEGGSNSNGRWIRLSDGTQICWKRALTSNLRHDRYLRYNWTFPNEFSANATVSVVKNNYWGGWEYVTSSVTAVGYEQSAEVRLWRQQAHGLPTDAHTNSNHSVNVIAIGRWRE